MIGVYNFMFAGLAVSAAAAHVLVHTGVIAAFISGQGQFAPLGWTALCAPLAVLLLLPSMARA